MTEVQQSKKPERVEYRLSDSYIENWGAVEMLRELFANVLDTDESYAIRFELRSGLGRNMGMATIEDWADGFPREFLMLGGGEDKTSKQIGQFKEGLKMAMLVAARKKRKFLLGSTGFSVSKVAMEDGQLGNGLTVYITEPSRVKGTKIQVQVTQREFNKAIQLFGGIKATGHTVAVAPVPNPGQSFIWRDKEAKKQSIYVNGLEVQKINTMFSYNIPGEEIKQHQNRDRTVLNWSEVKYKAVRMLANLEARQYIACAVIHMLSTSDVRYMDLDVLGQLPEARKGLWREAVEAELASGHKMKNTRSKLLRICVSNPYDSENDLVAMEQGYSVLPAEKYHNVFRNLYPNSSTVVKKEAKKQDKEIEPVPNKDLTDQEKSRIAEVKELVKPFFPDNLPGFRVFSESYINCYATGYWWRGKVWIRRDQLVIDGAAGLRHRLEIVLHELTHWRSRAGDRTRDFEKHLGFLAADIILATRSGKIEPLLDKAPEYEWIRVLNEDVEQNGRPLDDLLKEAGIPKDKIHFCRTALPHLRRCEKWILVQRVRDKDQKEKLSEVDDVYFWGIPKKRGKNVRVKIHQTRDEKSRGVYTLGAERVLYAPGCEWHNTFKFLSPQEE